ncbi:Acetyltransferase (GNAT) domain containing protein [Rhypophila decipiens]
MLGRSSNREQDAGVDAIKPSANTNIRTTLPLLPFPASSSRPTITTQRLVIRPLRESDLQSLYEIRSQPEVMKNSPRGRPDTDVSESKRVLDAYLAPKDEETFYFAICLKSSKDDDKMIGLGGCHRLGSMFGWPVVGYMIRREYWGMGMATEFLTAWLGLWEELERRGVVIDVDATTVVLQTLPSSVTLSSDSDTSGGNLKDKGDEISVVPTAPEQIVAWALADNVGSWRVMEKAGFEHLLTWKEADLRDPNVEAELKFYRYFVFSGRNSAHGNEW